MRFQLGRVRSEVHFYLSKAKNEVYFRLSQARSKKCVCCSPWKLSAGRSRNVFPLHLLQLRKHSTEHNYETQRTADYIRDRFCEENAVSSHMEGIRQQISQRYNNKYFTKQGEKDRLLLFI